MKNGGLCSRRSLVPRPQSPIFPRVLPPLPLPRLRLLRRNSFYRHVDKNSFYRHVFLHYIRTFDIEAVHVIFDSEKHVYKSLNFKTLSLTIAIVNGSRHESQHNKFTTRRAVGFMLYGARNEMECQGLGRTNLFLASPRSSRIFGNRTQDRQTARW